MRTTIPTLEAGMSDALAPHDLGNLARQYGRKVFHAAFQLLGDAALAEDVQQDVFVRLMEARTAEVASWPAYLTALATRLAIDRLRQQQRWRRLLPLWRETAAASSPGADQATLAAERTRGLRRALGRIGAREAQCFVLRFVHGMELGEIAATLDVSNNVVSVTLHRATQSLRRALGDTGLVNQEKHP